MKEEKMTKKQKAKKLKLKRLTSKSQLKLLTRNPKYNKI